MKWQGPDHGKTTARAGRRAIKVKAVHFVDFFLFGFHSTLRPPPKKNHDDAPSVGCRLDRTEKGVNYP